jgi:succinate dehydrogenase / fumarate reductase flavoprotein subunit
MNGYLSRSGTESVEAISKELGDVLTESAGIVRNNGQLKMALNKIQELKERWKKIVPSDKGTWANRSVIAIRKLHPSIVMGEAIITGALYRDESRGAHYKPDFPNRDDKNWLKTTVARYEDKSDKVTLDYKPVDISILQPQESNN